MAEKTKIELEQEVTDLRERNEELDDELQVREEERKDFEQRLMRMEALIGEQKETGEYAGPEPEMFYDPYDLQRNPHKFKKHPEGLRLSWLNAKFRDEDIGWRGWKAVTWDSEIGKNLNQYIIDPPEKMLGGSKQDNYVRRGTDTVLAAIDAELYRGRQANDANKALRKETSARAAHNRILAPGVETFGDGVKNEQAPPGGFKKMGAPPLPEGGHRTRLMHPEE